MNVESRISTPPAPEAVEGQEKWESLLQHIDAIKDADDDGLLHGENLPEYVALREEIKGTGEAFVSYCEDRLRTATNHDAAVSYLTALFFTGNAVKTREAISRLLQREDVKDLSLYCDILEILSWYGTAADSEALRTSFETVVRAGTALAEQTDADETELETLSQEAIYERALLALSAIYSREADTSGFEEAAAALERHAQRCGIQTFTAQEIASLATHAASYTDWEGHFFVPTTSTEEQYENIPENEDPFVVLDRIEAIEVRMEDNEKENEITRRLFREVAPFLGNLIRRYEGEFLPLVEDLFERNKHIRGAKAPLSERTRTQVLHYITTRQLQRPHITVLSSAMVAQGALKEIYAVSAEAKPDIQEYIQSLKKAGKHAELDEMMASHNALFTAEAHECVIVFQLPHRVAKHWAELDSVIPWGRIYRGLMPFVWQEVGEALSEKRLTIQRLNSEGEHDPDKYYYIWKVSLSAAL